LLDRLGVPEPWASTTAAALALVDDLDTQIDACERQLRRLGARLCALADDGPRHRLVLGYTIAAEIGDITRFTSPKKKLCGYTGLCPRVYQSGHRDHRGPPARNGPTYLRWA
jgi:transposase